METTPHATTAEKAAKESQGEIRWCWAILSCVDACHGPREPADPRAVTHAH